MLWRKIETVALGKGASAELSMPRGITRMPMPECPRARHLEGMKVTADCDGCVNASTPLSFSTGSRPKHPGSRRVFQYQAMSITLVKQRSLL